MSSLNLLIEFCFSVHVFAVCFTLQVLLLFMSLREEEESEGERDIVSMSIASMSRDMEESPAIAVLNSESAQLPLTNLIVSENDAMSGHHLHNPSPSVTLPASSSSPPPLTSVSEHTKSLSTTGTMCIVCGDMAPKDATFRRHYGVVCCEACKCFFRRTVQMSRDYKCRYGSSCSIGRNPVSMKQVCQACRFSQCIKAGMRMECECHSFVYSAQVLNNCPKGF